MLNLNNKSKKLLLLQRNELLTEKQKWKRKKFGRFLFTNFFINFNQAKNISLDAENLFKSEIDTFKNFLPRTCNNIMDIGCGLGIINILLNKFYNDKINFYLHSEINPALASHGGEVSLVEVLDDNKAVLQFGGGCQGCSMIDVTLKDGVEKTLVENVPEITGIIDSTDHSHTENAYFK